MSTTINARVAAFEHMLLRRIDNTSMLHRTEDVHKHMCYDLTDPSTNDEIGNEGASYVSMHMAAYLESLKPADTGDIRTMLRVSLNLQTLHAHGLIWDITFNAANVLLSTQSTRDNVLLRRSSIFPCLLPANTEMIVIATNERQLRLLVAEGMGCFIMSGSQMPPLTLTWQQAKECTFGVWCPSLFDACELVAGNNSWVDMLLKKSERRNSSSSYSSSSSST